MKKLISLFVAGFLAFQAADARGFGGGFHSVFHSSSSPHETITSHVTITPPTYRAPARTVRIVHVYEHPYYHQWTYNRSYPFFHPLGIWWWVPIFPGSHTMRPCDPTIDGRHCR